MGAEPGPRVRVVGRSTELTTLRVVVEEAAAGRARVAVIEGEPGIGKSCLLTDVLGLARGRGYRVFVGECDELERDRPLLALAEALDVNRAVSDSEWGELARLLRFGAGLAGRAGDADEGWLIVEGSWMSLRSLRRAAQSP
jgi:predicted ATPase